MPGFDRTGPMGAGPMTGGARGLCNPAKAGYDPGFSGGLDYGNMATYFRGWKPLPQALNVELMTLRPVSKTCDCNI